MLTIALALMYVCEAVVHPRYYTVISSSTVLIDLDIRLLVTYQEVNTSQVCPSS